MEEAKVLHFYAMTYRYLCTFVIFIDKINEDSMNKQIKSDKTNIGLW